MPEDRTPSTPQDAPGPEPKIGVYTCYCGGNISEAVNCERVAKILRQVPGVVAARTHMAMCSDAGQAMIAADIQEQGVNRVVIGACAPSLHEQTFRNTVARAGLNPYLYHHVGLREQDSWVHGDQPEAATDKAVTLMAAGIAKARLLEPLEAIRLPAEKRALVIGGGVAGLRATLDLARRGIAVTLIEKTPFLGGRAARLETIFPTNRSARAALRDLIEQVVAHPKVSILLQAELAEVAGYVGDYQLQVRVQARGVGPGFTGFTEAAAACPVEVPDAFNEGLTQRKAIYRAYPGCYPETPAIDWEHCTQCGACQTAGDLNLEPASEIVAVHAGAIVVATGFDLYTPRKGEFGYGELPEVITLAQLIRLMALTEAGAALEWNGRPVKSLAFIHCAGSRQVPGVHEPQADGEVNPYCSRVCCTAVLHTAEELQARFPNLHLFSIYQDIRAYGRGHEDYYTRVSANGMRFMGYHSDEIPEVVPAPAGDTYASLVRFNDTLTWGEALEAPADLVVLATGMIPNPVADLIQKLKISPGVDRFLLEVHPKLRPVETAVPGVVLAGTAQGPMNIQESCAAAAAAAAKAAGLLALGQVELEPYIARVNPEKCDGSGACVEVCAYEDAITLQSIAANGAQARRAVVTPANCSGCGACVSACPNQAIDVQGWTLAQFEAMIQAVANPNMLTAATTKSEMEPVQ